MGLGELRSLLIESTLSTVLLIQRKLGADKSDSKLVRIRYLNRGRGWSGRKLTFCAQTPQIKVWTGLGIGPQDLASVFRSPLAAYILRLGFVSDVVAPAGGLSEFRGHQRPR